MRIVAKPALVVLMALSMALSGCNGDGSETTTGAAVRTCPGGQTIPANVTGSPESACPKPAPPKLVLATPTDLRAYKEATFNWTILLGNHTGGHTMLTDIRVATASQPDDSVLAGPESYGAEITRQAHQNIPIPSVTFSGTHTFTTPGMYYVRAYATILADDLAGKDYWSTEAMIMVDDVVPTGNNTVVTHPVGNVAGKLDPAEVDLKVGDGIILKNDDLQARIFTADATAPACAPFTAPVTVPAGQSSPPLVFKAPGPCTFTTDDVQPQTLTVNVGT